MIFLIEYNRREGRLVSFKAYPSDHRLQADDDRLALELDLLRRGVKHEVVNLEAETEEILRRGYRRYFEGADPVAGPLVSSK